MNASDPVLKSRRAAALAACKILDTPPEPEFDRLTELASSIFNAPMSTLTFLDEHRQWFKSRFGVEASETPISQSFCYHAAARPSEIFVVKDAKEDQRFNTNPFVLGDPHVRFYAGVPIVLRNGVSIGALCVIDRKPRQMNSLQGDALRCLAAYAVDQIEARRLADVLKESSSHIRHLQSLLPVCPQCRDRRSDDRYTEMLNEYLSVMDGQFDMPPCPCCPPRKTARLDHVN